MTRLLSLISVCSLTTLALAQGSITAPIGGATGDGGGTSQNYFRELQSRWQSFVDTTVFTGQALYSPIQINTISFRPVQNVVGPTQAFTYANAEVYLQYAATDYATPSGTWAANRTVALPTTPNYLGNIVMQPVTPLAPVNNSDVVINLTTPFVYDPSLGQDLLVEIYLPTLPTPLMVIADATVRTCAYPIATTQMSTVRLVGPTSTTATGGALTQFTPIMKFDYSVPPNLALHDPYGQGCYIRGRSWYEAFPGTYPVSSNDLAGKTVQMTPNSLGGYDVLMLPGGAVTAPTTVGLALPDDGVSPLLTLPFTFDFPGGSTPQISVGSNGCIFASTTLGPAFFNQGDTPSTLLTAPVPVFAASCQDLLPDGVTNIANVFAEPDPASPTTRYLITWLNLPCFTGGVPSGLTSTFQIAITDNGVDDIVEYRYLTLTNDSDSYAGAALTGFSPGGTSLNPGNRDLTATVFFQSETDLAPLTLFGSPRPKFGVPVTYTLSEIRAGGFSLMQCSFGQFPTGVPLTAFGVAAPGCNAFVNPALMVSFGPLLFGAPTDGFSQTWPSGGASLPYLGLVLYVQGFELEVANPENAAGVIASNGLKVVLGVN